MARKRHTFYGLYDPIDKTREVRYVGYTSFTPEQRLTDHVYQAQRKAETYKQKWIRKLLRGGRVPVWFVLEISYKKDWKVRERKWIAYYRAEGHRLTNSTEGGEGLINPTRDVRKRISVKVSKSLIGNQRRKGIPHKLGFGKAQSKRLLASKKFKAAHRRRRGKPGHPQSAEARLKVSIANTGRSRPDAVFHAKALAKKNRGSFWANDGTNNKLLRKGAKVPKGFVLGRLVAWNDREWSVASRKKLSNSMKGQPGPEISVKGRRSISEQKKNSRWITDGAQLRTILVGQVPPPGWRFGMKLDPQ